MFVLTDSDQTDLLRVSEFFVVIAGVPTVRERPTGSGA